MTTDEILDQILIPRANGSEGFWQVARFIETTLKERGAEVSLHSFTAMPHGFQLVWSAALLLMLGYFIALAGRRYVLALLLSVITPLLLLAEFEFLRSPISGLLPLTENNIVGTFRGRDSGPTVLFCAHYDTTTHFGDHFTWYPWGLALGPATAWAIAMAAWGLATRGRARLPRFLLSMTLAVLVPFGAMFWFQALGPVLRTPSPGALDNGGSVAALLELAGHLARRAPHSPTTVKLVFLAAEEERALGSWFFAQTLDRAAPLVVINLESVGASEDLAYVPEDGFQFWRYRSPANLVRLVDETTRAAINTSLLAMPLPGGILTDGRSFLAQGIPAVTLRAAVGCGFPRHLHSARDSRERLSLPAIQRTALLLATLVARLDSDPELLTRLGFGMASEQD